MNMTRIKTAVILAAGLGTRFENMTKEIPKSFICVNGISMIERSVENLIAAGIERIIIGTGYRNDYFEALKSTYPQIETCDNPLYASTNSMWTLNICKEIVGDDDFLLLESDIIYEKRALDIMIDSELSNIILVSDVLKFQDQYYVECDANFNLTGCSVDKDTLDVYGEMVGIFKISSSMYSLTNRYFESIKEQNPKIGYEFCLLKIAKSKLPIATLKIEGLQWYEIDSKDDLDYAEKNICL